MSQSLSKRAVVWFSTAAVAWAMIFVGRGLGLFDTDADDGPTDPSAQQLNCSADQIDANGTCW